MSGSVISSGDMMVERSGKADNAPIAAGVLLVENVGRVASIDDGGSNPIPIKITLWSITDVVCSDVGSLLHSAGLLLIGQPA